MSSPERREGEDRQVGDVPEALQRLLPLLIPGSGDWATPKQGGLSRALRETAAQDRCCQSRRGLLVPRGVREAEGLRVLGKFKARWDRASSGHIGVPSDARATALHNSSGPQ